MTEEPGRSRMTSPPRHVTSTMSRPFGLGLDSSCTMRAPLQEAIQEEEEGSPGGRGQRVLVVDGHSHQLLLTASLSRRTASGSREGDGGTGSDKDTDPEEMHLQLSARRAQKFRLGGVFFMRFAMAYGAAIVVAYLFIFGINTLIKYVMSVLVTAVGIQGYTGWGILTICGVPVLCIFLSSLASLSLGMLLDIWHDYEWVDACIEAGHPAFKQWIPFATNLLLPFAVYAVWSFVNPFEAYTYALLASLVCLLALYSVYFITVLLSQARICYTLVDDGLGFWATMYRLLWVVTSEAYSIRFCLPGHLPKGGGRAAVGHQANPGQSTAGVARSMQSNPLCVRASTAGDQPASQVHCQQPSRSGGFLGCCPTLGDDLEFDQHTLRGVPETMQAACNGCMAIRSRWTPYSLRKEKYGYSLSHGAPLTSSCCFLPGTKGMSSLSGFLAFMILCVFFLLAIVGTTTQSPDQASATDILVSVVLAVLLILCCCWPAINRLRPRRQGRGCGFTQDDRAHTKEQIPVYVPNRHVRAVTVGCTVAAFMIAPIVAFTGLAVRTGQWYLNGIVFASVVFALFVCLFNIDKVRRWAGPAGMRKLQSRSWKLARQAHLLETRMHLRVARLSFLTALSLLACVLLAISISGINEKSSTYAGVDYSYNATFQSNGTGQQYPLCTLRQPIANISVLDYAFLSDTAYIHNTTQARLRVDQYFGDGVMLTTLQEFKSFSGDTFGSFFTMRVIGTNNFIIAIRGTSTLFDLIADANLWIEVALIQLMRFLLPAGNAWNPAYPYIINALNLDQGADAFNYYTDIQAAVEQLLKIPGSTVVLTGHSLGGGLGMIVSAKSGVPAILFSGPNAMLSRLKFNVTAAQLNTWPVNVIPGSDPVSHVDVPGDLAQRIHCNDKGLSCHHMDRTQCELQNACGSFGRPAIAHAQCAKYGYSYTLQ